MLLDDKINIHLWKHIVSVNEYMPNSSKDVKSHVAK